MSRGTMEHLADPSTGRSLCGSSNPPGMGGRRTCLRCTKIHMGRNVAPLGNSATTTDEILAELDRLVTVWGDVETRAASTPAETRAAADALVGWLTRNPCFLGSFVLRTARASHLGFVRSLSSGCSCSPGHVCSRCSDS